MTKELKKISKKKTRSCIICHKKLKVFEYNLCSCGENVCIKHVNRNLHDCKKIRKIVLSKSGDNLNDLNDFDIKLTKIASPKIDKI